MRLATIVIFSSLLLAPQLTADGPVTSAEWLARGDAALAANELDDAASAYALAAAEGASANRARLGLVTVALRRGDVDGAAAHLQKLAPPAPLIAHTLKHDPAYTSLRGRPEYAAALQRIDPCSSPLARQFDFWLGQWTVRDKAGKLLGHSRIESVLDGCAVAEFWTAASGVAGQSINFYDPGTRQWHQFWTDTSGTAWLSRDAHGNPATARGGLTEGNMVLMSDPATRPLVRGSWSPLPDGRVRQMFEQSSDGVTWTVTFDGYYTRLDDPPH